MKIINEDGERILRECEQYRITPGNGDMIVLKNEFWDTQKYQQVAEHYNYVISRQKQKQEDYRNKLKQRDC